MCKYPTLKTTFVSAIIASFTLGIAFNIPVFNSNYIITLPELLIIIGISIGVVFSGEIRFNNSDPIPIFYIFLITVGIISALSGPNTLRALALMVPIGFALLMYIIVLNISLTTESIQPYVSYGIRILIITQVAFLSINMSPIIFADNIPSFYIIKNQYAITPFGSSNYLATYFGVGLAYEVLQRYRSWILYGVVSLIGLGLTLSRGGLLATLVGISVALYLTNNSPNKYKITGSIVASIAFLGFSLILLLPELVRNAIAIFGGFSTGYARVGLWENVFTQIQGSPLLGTGLDYENNPHNVLLLALQSFGVIGFVPFILFVVYMVKYATVSLVENTDAKGPAVGILVLLAHYFVEPGFFSVASQLLLATFLATIVSQFDAGRDLTPDQPV